MQQEIPTVIIIGAGLGGLTLYHALIKNKDKKEFNVKIFERELGPQDRWQGYHIGINNHGVRSLMNCLPSSVALNLPKAMPNPIHDECHGFSISDHTGDLLMRLPSKQVKDVYEIEKLSTFSAIVTYRDRLRDVLLENVPVQWGKKCVRYEETEAGVWVFFEDGSREFCEILIGADGINSPVRKQKIPELQIFDYGVTQINADVTVPKSLMDRFIKVSGNSLFQKTIGLNGDVTFVIFRLIPIEQQNDENENEPHYRTSIGFNYPTKLDDDKNENEKFEVDDNDPASIIQHVKQMIRKFRPDCEMTDLLLELWELVPKTTPNDPIKYPFKTYNPVQRRKIQDINPLSVNSWTSSRVTLLGDAAHAMSPVLGLGANNAIRDADNLSQALLNYYPKNIISCIKKYENEMLKRTSADVIRSRTMTLRHTSPVGYYGSIFRNGIMKIMNTIMNICDNEFFFKV